MNLLSLDMHVSSTYTHGNGKMLLDWKYQFCNSFTFNNSIDNISFSTQTTPFLPFLRHFGASILQQCFELLLITAYFQKIYGFHAKLPKKQQNKFHRILVKTQKYTNIDDQPEVGSPCVRQLSNVWWITKIIWCPVHITILRAKRFFWIWWNLLLVSCKKER